MELRIESERVAQALASLRHHSEFQVVLRWLGEHAQAARIDNDTELVTDLLRQRQGWIQALAAIETEVRNIDITIGRFRDSRNR